jgi:hypothetical protein
MRNIKEHGMWNAQHGPWNVMNMEHKREDQNHSETWNTECGTRNVEHKEQVNIRERSLENRTRNVEHATWFVERKEQ